MGMNLGDIFKKDEETLVIDRKKQAIKALIIFTVVILFLLVLIVVLRNIGDIDEERRISITRDIQNIKNYVTAKRAEFEDDPKMVLPGKSLSNSPLILNVNGVEEEYRYGYYFINTSELNDLNTALNLPNEQYIVNYDSYDVVNYTGIKYNNRRYHSIDDLLAIQEGKDIPSNNTVIIKVAGDMQKLHQQPNAHFKLAGNIDMSGINWEPVESFSGTFDGRGYTIKNFKISKASERYVGLFAETTSNVIIKNLNFYRVDVAGEDYTGILVGANSGQINNVQVLKGSVRGQTKVGGLVGSHQGETISNCSVELDSTAGRENVGGLVGELNSGKLDKCRVICDVIQAAEIAGGIVGGVTGSDVTYVTACSAKTTLTGDISLGGLFGKVEMLTPKKSINVINCYSKGTIENGTENMGGIAGYVRTGSDVDVIIEDSYVAMDLLKKGTTTGAGIGRCNSSSSWSVSGVYWEKDLAPGATLNDIGEKIGTSSVNLTAKTPNEMRIRTTFENWDWDVWKIDERKDTPYLKFEKGFENTFQEFIEEEKK